MPSAGTVLTTKLDMIFPLNIPLGFQDFESVVTDQRWYSKWWRRNQELLWHFMSQQHASSSGSVNNSMWSHKTCLINSVLTWHRALTCTHVSLPGTGESMNCCMVALYGRYLTCYPGKHRSLIGNLWQSRMNLNWRCILHTAAYCLQIWCTGEECPWKTMHSWYTVRWRCNAVNFLLNPHKYHHSSPVRAGYGVYLWFDSDSYSSSVNVMLYEISCYIGPHYNSTRLYILSEWTP